MASNLARTLGMEQCGHMAICDAHARYRDYGIIALPLILLFPGSRTSDGEPASEWQEAALRGKAREECYSSQFLGVRRHSLSNILYRQN